VEHLSPRAFTEERDVDQNSVDDVHVPPLIVGVMLRLVGPAYKFADLSLEGAFLMGLLGGRVVGRSAARSSPFRR